MYKSSVQLNRQNGRGHVASCEVLQEHLICKVNSTSASTFLSALVISFFHNKHTLVPRLFLGDLFKLTRSCQHADVSIPYSLIDSRLLASGGRTVLIGWHHFEIPIKEIISTFFGAYIYIFLIIYACGTCLWFGSWRSFVKVKTWLWLDKTHFNTEVRNRMQSTGVVVSACTASLFIIWASHVAKEPWLQRHHL